MQESPIGPSKDDQFSLTANVNTSAQALRMPRALTHPEWRKLPTGEQTFANHELPQAGPVQTD